MKIDIQSLHFTARQELIDFIEQKVGRLERLSNELIGSDVILKVENTDTKENKVAEIRVMVPGNDLWAESKGKSFEEAVLDCIEIIERQIRKNKTKILAQRKETDELKNIHG